MNFFSITLGLLFCFGLFGQNVIPQQQLPNANYSVTKVKQKSNKSYGDTLWSEDFNGGLPTGWSIVNNNPNNFDWQWDTIYRPGQYSRNIPTINSSSSGNGFMLLPMDFFNTPIPGFAAVSFDTYFQSPAIPINPKVSVELRAQQFSRFCCSSANRMVVQVSSDNFSTFDEYPMNTYPTNQTSPNVENFKLSISQTLAGEDTAYLRFYVQSASHYFWMIDDLALVEGNGQQIESANFYKPSLSKGPFPIISPTNYLNDIAFEASVKNSTGDTITGVNLGVEVNHVKNVNGSGGVGLVYATNQLANNGGVIDMQRVDTIRTSAAPFYFTPLLFGDYEVDFFANSIEYPTRDSAKLRFVVSDTVFGRDFSSPSTPVGTAGAGTWVPVNGDCLGSLFYIDSIQQNVQFSSVSFYVSNDYDNIGAVIRPVIWEYNSDTAFATGIVNGFGRELASSLSNFTVTANDTNTWVSLKLDTGIAMSRITNVGEFVVGWEMVGGAPSGSSFSVWNDLSAREVAPNVSHFMSLAHLPTQPNWAWLRAAPMVRLNIKPLLVGIDKFSQGESSIQISPNPSNGVFQIKSEWVIQAIEIFDVEGSVIDVNFQNNSFDLRYQKAGIYFVRILGENGNWFSEKVVKF